MLLGRASLTLGVCAALLYGGVATHAVQTAQPQFQLTSVGDKMFPETPVGQVGFDAHGCYVSWTGSAWALVQNGDCYVRASGTIYNAYPEATFAANSWSTAGLTPTYQRDFADPSGMGQSLSKYWFVQYPGNSTWFRVGSSMSDSAAYVNNEWVTLAEYKQIEANTQQAIDQINDQANRKGVEDLLRPPCDYSYNGC